MVSDIHRNVLIGQEGTDGQCRFVSATFLYPSITVLTIPKTETRSAISNTVGSVALRSYSISPGELPPPPPRACFGRDELIERIVGLAEDLTPIALIGTGGIGKTSIALNVLHDYRVKRRFGENRRFIRCDQFPPSLIHFLGRLSKAIGADTENPEDLTSLRRSLSSKEMLIILDNVESILDPRGANAREIYAVTEELSHFSNICLCVTSRITTIPPDYKRLDVPTLSMDAARNAFFRIYDDNERPDLISRILEQLDFHPLSVTLLATVAHQNKWDNTRLVREWEQRRTGVLQTEHNKSLAATIEFSLTSPIFQELGPDARDILGVVAFFPQGVDENNLDWLFPTGSIFSRLLPIIPGWSLPSAPDRKNIFDKFCVLSLTYRSDGFVTMLAPLRDHLCPKSPGFSPLLHMVKRHYLRRLSVWLNPGKPGFEEARWITSEDMNVEHLLDVFTEIDPNSGEVWNACAYFMRHLHWHKPRLVVLGPKIEGLPDDHPSKPQCLFELSRLFRSAGNHEENKRLLTLTLELWRERGNILEVAEALRFLAETNRQLLHHQEGISRLNEALEIYERFNNTSGRVFSLQLLAWLLHSDNQLDAAEEAASRAIDLLSNKGEQFQVCQCHCILGNISQSKGETKKAIDHFETALGMASSSNWHGQLFWNHYSLAQLFFDEGRFGDAHAHVERAKSQVINDPYLSGRAMELEARFWYRESRPEEARSEALRAADIYEKIGAAKGVEDCKAILRSIEENM